MGTLAPGYFAGCEQTVRDIGAPSRQVCAIPQWARHAERDGIARRGKEHEFQILGEKRTGYCVRQRLV